MRESYVWRETGLVQELQFRADCAMSGQMSAASIRVLGNTDASSTDACRRLLDGDLRASSTPCSCSCKCLRGAHVHTVSSQLYTHTATSLAGSVHSLLECPAGSEHWWPAPQQVQAPTGDCQPSADTSQPVSLHSAICLWRSAIPSKRLVCSQHGAIRLECTPCQLCQACKQSC